MVLSGPSHYVAEEIPLRRVRQRRTVFKNPEDTPNRAQTSRESHGVAHTVESERWQAVRGVGNVLGQPAAVRLSQMILVTRLVQPDWNVAAGVCAYSGVGTDP